MLAPDPEGLGAGLMETNVAGRLPPLLVLQARRAALLAELAEVELQVAVLLEPDRPEGAGVCTVRELIDAAGGSISESTLRRCCKDAGIAPRTSRVHRFTAAELFELEFKLAENVECNPAQRAQAKLLKGVRWMTASIEAKPSNDGFDAAKPSSPGVMLDTPEHARTLIT